LPGKYGCWTPCTEDARPAFISNQVTLSAWIKWTGTPADYLGKTPTVVAYGHNYSLQLSNGNLSALGNGEGNSLDSTTSVVDGKWHHVAMTARPPKAGELNGEGVLYVDGREVKRGNLTVGMETTGHEVIVGGRNGVHEFVGYIDDVFIYTQALGK
jgi:hypothetical protein